MVRVVKKADVRRAEIIQAARALFQTKGYDQTTTQDVMETLNIAKGTIYHYFTSKEELLEAVVMDIVDDSVAQMQALLEQAQGTALEKISLLVRAGRMSDENQAILDSLHHSSNRDMHIRLLATALLKQAPLYARIIRQGCDEGVFQTDTPLECAEFFLSALQFLTDVGIYPWTQEDLIRRIKAFPAIIEAQLKAPADSFQWLITDMLAE
jgi:AcrR family transcriptional regulator